MSNVLNQEKQQQVLALGRLGWSLRRIEQATGVRRETVSAYLKAIGIAVRLPGGKVAKPATEVSTDSGAKPASGVSTDLHADSVESPERPAAPPTASPQEEKPRPRKEDFSGSAIPDSIPHLSPSSSGSISLCESYQDVIEQSLVRERNGTLGSCLEGRSVDWVAGRSIRAMPREQQKDYRWFTGEEILDLNKRASRHVDDFARLRNAEIARRFVDG